MTNYDDRYVYVMHTSLGMGKSSVYKMISKAEIGNDLAWKKAQEICNAKNVNLGKDRYWIKYR